MVWRTKLETRCGEARPGTPLLMAMVPIPCVISRRMPQALRAAGPGRADAGPIAAAAADAAAAAGVPCAAGRLAAQPAQRARHAAQPLAAALAAGRAAGAMHVPPSFPSEAVHPAPLLQTLAQGGRQNLLSIQPHVTRRGI